MGHAPRTQDGKGVPTNLSISPNLPGDSCDRVLLSNPLFREWPQRKGSWRRAGGIHRVHEERQASERGPKRRALLLEASARGSHAEVSATTLTRHGEKTLPAPAENRASVLDRGSEFIDPSQTV